jgi:hypothetical protein
MDSGLRPIGRPRNDQGKFFNNLLGLELFADWPLPNESDSDVFKQYKDFITQVDHFSVQIQIAHVRESGRGSVGLDTTEKQKIRHYVEQIKGVIDDSSLEIAKRERLYDKINDFLAELDKDRTPLRVLSDVVIALSHTGGEAAKELEPAWKWVKLIASVFGGRQQNERDGLPKPRPQKKLEAPKRRLPAPRTSNSAKVRDLDDDIPF